MGAITSLITSLTIAYSTVYSDADQRKHQSSASLAFVWGNHRGPVNSPHKWLVTRKVFPFDDVIMDCHICVRATHIVVGHFAAWTTWCGVLIVIWYATINNVTPLSRSVRQWIQSELMICHQVTTTFAHNDVIKWTPRITDRPFFEGNLIVTSRFHPQSALLCGSLMSTLS